MLPLLLFLALLLLLLLLMLLLMLLLLELLPLLLKDVPVVLVAHVRPALPPRAPCHGCFVSGQSG